MEKKILKKNEEKNNLKKNFEFFLTYVTPRPPMSVHKKFQPNRSSRLAGYREHLYECLVLLYRQPELSKSSVIMKAQKR